MNTGISELEAEIFGALNHRFPYYFVVFNSSLRIEYLSAGTAELIGYESGDLLGQTVGQLVHPDDFESSIPVALETMASGNDTIANPSAAQSVEIPVRLLTRTGGYMAVVLSGRVLESGRLLCVLRPSAERYALDNVLRKLSGGADLVTLLDGVVNLCLSQFPVRVAWVITPEGTVATTPCETNPDLDLGHVMSGLGQDILVVTSDSGGELWVVPIIGGISGATLGALVLPASRADGPSAYDAHILGRTADLAGLAFARAKFDQVLRQAANTDPLTGALNRRAVERHIGKLARTDGVSTAVLFADLDGFKAVNDLWGHAVGDEVLMTVAARITAGLREGDVLGRLGGDEFVAVCRADSPEVLERLRDRLESAVAEPMQIQGKQIRVSVSIGVAFAAGVAGVDGILGRSDADMYERKRERQVRMLTGQR